MWNPARCRFWLVLDKELRLCCLPMSEWVKCSLSSAASHWMEIDWTIIIAWESKSLFSKVTSPKFCIGTASRKHSTLPSLHYIIRLLMHQSESIYVMYASHEQVFNFLSTLPQLKYIRGTDKTVIQGGQSMSTKMVKIGDFSVISSLKRIVLIKALTQKLVIHATIRLLFHMACLW